jgi:hypothetical protein
MNLLKNWYERLKIKNRLKRRNKVKSVTSLLSLTEVSEETTRDQQVVNHICEQFMMFYMDKCIRDLVCDRKWVNNYIVDKCVYNV